MGIPDFSITANAQSSTVANLIEEIQDRIPEDKIENIFPVLNRAVRTIAKRLFMVKSDLIISGLNLSYSAADQYKALPNDFWGLVEKPYISGLTWQLQPSPGIETEIQYISSGQPYYFRVKGLYLWLYPATATAITVCGDYFQKPDVLTQMEDLVPYAQLLDDAIQEYLIMTMAGGSAASAGSLKSFLEEQVDIVVANRSQKAATPMPDAIFWDNL